jgi:hypothetical protein
MRVGTLQAQFDPPLTRELFAAVSLRHCFGIHRAITRRHCEPVQFGGVLAFRPSPFAVLLMKEKRMLQAENRIDRLLGTEHAKPLLSLAQLPFSLSRDVRSMNSSMIGCRPPVRRFSPAFAGTVIFGSGVAAAFTPSLLSMSRSVQSQSCAWMRNAGAGRVTHFLTTEESWRFDVAMMKRFFALLAIGLLTLNLHAAEKPKAAKGKLTSIQGIAEATEAKLNAAGVTSVEELLEKGATPKGREELAQKSECLPRRF